MTLHQINPIHYIIPIIEKENANYYKIFEIILFIRYY